MSFDKKNELASFAGAIQMNIKALGYALKTSQTGELNG